MNLEYLADHPEWAPVLARWHHAEWADLLPGWNEATALAELRSHTGRAGVPTTLVAVEGDQPVGSVSLIEDDLDEWKGKYSPWLASLYVLPSARGRGIGTALAARAVEEARRAGVKTLYVFAARSETYYASMGWNALERVVHRGCPSAVMSLHLI